LAAAEGDRHEADEQVLFEDLTMGIAYVFPTKRHVRVVQEFVMADWFAREVLTWEDDGGAVRSGESTEEGDGKEGRQEAQEEES